jgi:hypothetical protein
MTPRTPSRPKENLSRVYLDDYPITLMGDEAAPPLSRIIRAGGKKPDRVDVVYLTSPADRKGLPVDPETIIDRTAEPTRPIYLRTLPKAKQVLTADRPDPRSIPDLPSAPTSRDPMPNLDPVISQLGGARVADPADLFHEEAVFRSPTQVAEADAATIASLRAATVARAARLANAKAAQATAEGEAEQRQEDERNQEDALQDEEEALQDADEDAETQK